jgi:uncharacterized protein with NAD-binding domain and iron-sulfur cluster
MKKFVGDLLKTAGKWSFKRVTALYVLNIAIVYAVLPIFIPSFNVQEFVFWGFLTYSGTMIGMVLKQKLSGTTEEIKVEEPLIFEEDNEQNH